MSTSKVKGYNIVLTVGGKSIIGTTSDNFSGGGTTKESIEKKDLGIKQKENTGYEGKISVNANVRNGQADTGEMGIEDLLTACKNNTEAAFVLVFGTDSGDPKVTGNAVFMSCTVNSDSENYANCSVELQINELPSFTTV